MLEVMVKTLDSQSRSFSVEDGITVQGFKEHISDSVNIPVGRQRLIFQGRVLQDNTQLNSSDISGKVIHLVERLPASAQPTPAELARERPRTQQSTNQGNAQPRGPTPQANILGPFPVPSGTPGNISVPLVQQMIQQAMGGMTSLIRPTMVRSSVRHPNAPGGDSRTEIQIHITQQGASAASQSAPANQRQQGPRAPQQGDILLNYITDLGVPAQSRNTQQAQAPQQNIRSEPRRILDHVEHLLTKLEKNVTDLETGNFEKTSQTQENQGGEQPSASTGAIAESSSEPEGSDASTEPMDVQSSESSHQTETENDRSSVDALRSGEEAASRTGDSSESHPFLPEFGRVMRRLTAAETRFLPFLSEYTDFLENDTAFTNTESPEFKTMKGFVNTVLKAQRSLGLIHRALARVAIPLSGTPPRRMFMRCDCCPRNRGVTRQARRIQNSVSAGHYLHQPTPRPCDHHSPHGPRGPIQG